MTTSPPKYFDRIVDLDDAAGEDARADAAPARVEALRHAREILLKKRSPDFLARAGVLGDEQARFPCLQLDAWHDPWPLDSGDGEVLARRARADRMPFVLERVNDVKREENDGTIGSAVKSAVALSIAVDASLVHERFEDAFLWHAASRNIDRSHNPDR